MKRIYTILASLTAATWAGAALADAGYLGGYGQMMGGGFGMFGGVMMLFFWGAVIMLVVYGLRGWSDAGRSANAGRKHDAVELLRDRFARGEIDEEEFRRKKTALET